MCNWFWSKFLGAYKMVWRLAAWRFRVESRKLEKRAEFLKRAEAMLTALSPYEYDDGTKMIDWDGRYNVPTKSI
jgi:hypothetical protein